MPVSKPPRNRLKELFGALVHIGLIASLGLILMFAIAGGPG